MTRYLVTFPESAPIPVDVTRSSQGGLQVRVNGRERVVESLGRKVLRIGAKVVEAWPEASLGDVRVLAHRQRFAARVEIEGATHAGSLDDPLGQSSIVAVRAPLPGRVIKLFAQVGQTVEEDTPLVVIEAMKMENEVRALRSFVVSKIHVEPGQRVDNGALLIEGMATCSNESGDSPSLKDPPLSKNPSDSQLPSDSISGSNEMT